MIRGRSWREREMQPRVVHARIRGQQRAEFFDERIDVQDVRCSSGSSCAPSVAAAG